MGPNNEAVPDSMVYCPIYRHDISDGLCWDVANIGTDELMLSDDEKPPCSWDEAHKVCQTCPEYEDMGR